MRAFLSAALLLLLAAVSVRAATVSGMVLDLDGRGIQNVSVTMTGSANRLAVTDATGAYTFVTVPLGGNYLLTPTKAGCVFTPATRSTTTLSNDWTGINFVFGKTWSGAGGDNLASNPANWTASTTPVTGDIARFDGTAASQGCLWDLPTRMEAIQLTVAYASSVVAGVDITVGSVTVSGGEFLTQERELHVSKNFVHTGGRFRAGPGGTAFFEGSTVQIVSMVPGSLGAGLYDSYFNGFRVVSSSSVRLGSVVVADGTFNISSGRFDMQTSTLTLTGGTQSGLGGVFNWDDSGGRFIPGSGAVTFDSRIGGTYEIRQDPSNTFKNLNVAGSSALNMLSALSASGVVQVAQVDGNPSLNLGNGFVHTFSHTVLVGPTAVPTVPAVTVGSSTVVLQLGMNIGTATVLVQGGLFQIVQSTLQVSAQGTLKVSGSLSSEFSFWGGTQLGLTGGALQVLSYTAFASTAPANTRFSTIFNGPIDIEAFCMFDSLDVNGFHIGRSAQPIHMDNLSFVDGSVGGAAINFDPVPVANVTINSPQFDASISTNVRAIVDPLVAASPSVNVILASGERSDFIYEYDPFNVIHWGVLGIPAGFTGALLGISSVTWSWNIVNHPLGFYVVSSTGGPVSPALTGDTTSWTEINLSTNANVTRRVRAFTDVNQADSNPFSLFTAAAPPAGLRFAEVVVSSITLAWDLYPNPAGTVFAIDRSTDDVTYTRIGRGPFESIQPYSDTGLIPERRYYYKVISENGDGVVTFRLPAISSVTLPVPPPIIFAVAPSTGPNLGLTTITVHGGHIQSNALLRLRRPGPLTIPAQNVTVLNENTISGTLHLTGAPAGAWDVEIENPDGKFSAGSGLGAFTIVDSPNVGAITAGNFDASGPFVLPSSDGSTLLSMSAGAFPSSRIYISVDPKNFPLEVLPSEIDGANAALKEWILIPNTLREILAYTPQGLYSDGFSSKVTLGISFPDADHDGVIDSVMLRRSTLRMMTLNTSTHEWDLLPDSSIDIVNNRVSAPLSHFSVYALFGSPAAPDLSQAKVYPSPWKPGSKGAFNATHLTFSDLTESGEIRIYNSAGKLVKTLTFNAAQAGICTWNGVDESGSPLSSGVYFAFIKSSAGSNVTLKFGVER